MVGRVLLCRVQFGRRWEIVISACLLGVAHYTPPHMLQLAIDNWESGLGSVSFGGCGLLRVLVVSELLCVLGDVG